MKTKYDNVLLGFIIKSVFLSVVIVAFLTALLSKLVMALDMDNSLYKYIGYIILFITAVIVGFISTSKFKNSLFLMSVLSNTPVLILSVINSVVDKSFVQFCISVVIILLGSFFASILNAEKTRKLKV